MFGTILKATNSSFKKGMTYCRSIYVMKVMKLLVFIFEQPSYIFKINYKACVAQLLSQYLIDGVYIAYQEGLRSQLLP